MRPSSTTGSPAAAPPTTNPARAAISRPPSEASTSIGSPLGPQRATAWSTTATLRASVASSMPVPRPVTSAAGRPVRAATRAAAGVVLPMPMSPVNRHCAPSAARSAATWAPTSSALRASPSDMAGSRAMLPVPRRTFACRRPGAAGRSPATPTSTTRTRAPTWRARTFTAAPPAQKLATICAVTSAGHGDTPSANTPWSPANTATAAGSGTGGGHRRAMAASRMPADSRRPSDPEGFVRRSWRAAAAAAAVSSGGTRRDRASANAGTARLLLGLDRLADLVDQGGDVEQPVEQHQLQDPEDGEGHDVGEQHDGGQLQMVEVVLDPDVVRDGRPHDGEGDAGGSHGPERRHLPHQVGAAGLAPGPIPVQPVRGEGGHAVGEDRARHLAPGVKDAV